MDSQKRAALEVKIDEAHHIDLTTESIDPMFVAEVYESNPTTTTGLTALFRVLSKEKSLPSFVIRWDDRDQTVDVDPERFDAIPKSLWKEERNGYSGHHAKKVSASPRVNQVELHIPGRLIFKGLLRFNIGIGVQLHDSVALSDSCSATVARSAPEK